ncbi:zinc-binding dehydrogenase [Ktedonobacter racemifer]|uniref:Alcohol dehydrogenase zinc-binding domain protein n=1 Tax=Ktedonobacter racemifer DSM 44963 TaxID=485913 RepID=D6TMJ6_KTERA|nr:zinc-binding dehydrogenase [Ktedonobacter racemifer]EFH86996.1 Alcohol dehydrogenase zinc-binding domain protein [Ktedonobacter racemifer DSM 44963]
MSSIHAIVVDPGVQGRLAIKEVEAPQAGPSEALVQVEAISLNRGEVLRAMGAEAGWRPGWDLAGTIIKQAANGTGPKVGSRVVGSVGVGAWAEQVAVQTSRLADIPASLTFARAATLPTAGLTALRALEKGGFLLNKRVLITGSTGGVGLFAHQLARLSGAYVVGTARHARNEAFVREAGADEVIVGDDLEPARAYGPYHLIIDSVGGKTLESALSLLATGATCVTLGWSASPSVTMDVSNFILTGRTTLYGLNMYTEFDSRARSEDLAWLAHMVAKQQLQTPIEVEASWHNIGEVAQRLLQRQFTGKAVLHLT